MIAGCLDEVRRVVETMNGVSGTPAEYRSPTPFPKPSPEMDGSDSVTLNLKELLRQVSDAGTDPDQLEHVVLEVLLDVDNESVTLRSVGNGNLTVEKKLSLELERKSSFSSLRAAGSPLELEAQDGRRLSKHASPGARVTPLAFSPERDDDPASQIHPRSTRNTPNHRGTPGSRGTSSPRLSVTRTPAFARATGLSRPTPSPMQISRTSSGAGHALEGLRNISKAADIAAEQPFWKAVEERFFKLASADEMLSRSDFAACIGQRCSGLGSLYFPLRDFISSHFLVWHSHELFRFCDALSLFRFSRADSFSRAWQVEQAGLWFCGLWHLIL